MMTEPNDEKYFRALLEEAQKGVEKVQLFVGAVETSEAARKNVPLQGMIQSTKTHLEQLEHEADRLWDHFKRVLKDG